MPTFGDTATNLVSITHNNPIKDDHGIKDPNQVRILLWLPSIFLLVITSESGAFRDGSKPRQQGEGKKKKKKSLPHAAAGLPNIA